MTAEQIRGGHVCPREMLAMCSFPFCGRSSTVLARQGRPDFRLCDAAHLQKSGRTAWQDTQIRQTMDPPCPPLRGFKCRAASGETKKTTDRHAYGQAPTALAVLRDGDSSPLLLGHWRGRAKRFQDGRVRFIGAGDKRHLTISTVVTVAGAVMAQLFVECATVVQYLPEHKKIFHSFRESQWCTESRCQELFEWLGERVRKQRFLQRVLLCECSSVHPKASLMEWVRAAHPEYHVLFIPGGYKADISSQQPL